MKPIILNLDFLQLYSYPLFIGLAWGVAYNFIHSYFEKNTLPKRNLNTFLLFNFIFSWVGSKVFFLMFSAGDMISQYIDNSNFWLGGGFVFYGGFVFCTLFSTIAVYKFNMIDRESLKFFIPTLTLAHGVGRIGCFLAGCCYGVQTHSFVGVHMHGHFRHPVQIYESAFLLALFYLFNKRVTALTTKSLILYYFVAYGIGRFTLEFFRGDKVRGEVFNLSSSQLVSVSVILCSLVFYILGKKKPAN